jgi:glycosyltransferase involved in cell wall biosynthesis
MNVSSRPLVTIAIPTYNRVESFLPRSLESARAQSYSNLEILVSDNCSTDGTREYIEAITDNRIRYHRHDANMGSSANEAFCLREARGTYIVILPDDDLMDPDLVESCIGRLDGNQQRGLVRCGTRVIDAAGQTLWESPNLAVDLPFNQYVIAWIDGRTSPYQCSTLFHTESLRSVGLRSRHQLFNDLMTHFKVAARYGRLDIPQTKASFRQHGNSETDRTSMRAWCEESADLLDLLCELCPEHRDLIRVRGTRFLAFGNYRRALRRRFPQSLLACLTVYFTHGLTPPPRALVAQSLRRLMHR